MRGQRIRWQHGRSRLSDGGPFAVRLVAQRFLSRAGYSAHARDAERTARSTCISCIATEFLRDESGGLATIELTCLAYARGSVPFDNRSQPPCPQQEPPLMRRIVLIIAVFSGLLIASTASAEQMKTSRSQASATKKGPIAKLVDMERRKNEWLREKMGR